MILLYTKSVCMIYSFNHCANKNMHAVCIFNVSLCQIEKHTGTIVDSVLFGFRCFSSLPTGDTPINSMNQLSSNAHIDGFQLRMTQVFKNVHCLFITILKSW